MTNIPQSFASSNSHAKTLAAPPLHRDCKHAIRLLEIAQTPKSERFEQALDRGTRKCLWLMLIGIIYLAFNLYSHGGPR